MFSVREDKILRREMPEGALESTQEGLPCSKGGNLTNSRTSGELRVIWGMNMFRLGSPSSDIDRYICVGGYLSQFIVRLSVDKIYTVLGAPIVTSALLPASMKLSRGVLTLAYAFVLKS